MSSPRRSTVPEVGASVPLTRLKKLNGARLSTPSLLRVDIQPTGLGTTQALSGEMVAPVRNRSPSLRMGTRCSDEPTIRLFAASSLQDVLPEILDAYAEDEHRDVVAEELSVASAPVVDERSTITWST